MTEQTKIALVTGGSRGLGRDMAINLAQKGYHVIITYLSNAEAAKNVLEEITQIGQQALALPLDTGDIKSFDSFIVTLGDKIATEFGSERIDYLINNAGNGMYGSVTETSESMMDNLYHIHFKGVYFLTQKLLPMMNDGGGIVNVSSGLTRVSFPNVSVYAAMKGAIEVYTKCLAKELGGRKIRANVVAPGAIATDFGGGSNKTDEVKRKAIAGMTALGRIGEAEDIGPTIAFLCSPESTWINGQRIELSGGMSL